MKYSHSLTWEISRYIPIGFVACMEGYFRKLYAELINYGSIYKENADNNFPDIKFSIEIAISFEKHSFSIGDFVAHLLPTNNLEEINKNINTLIGGDFLEKLKAERKFAIPHSYEALVDEPYIGEPDYNRLNNYMIKSVIPSCRQSCKIV